MRHKKIRSLFLLIGMVSTAIEAAPTTITAMRIAPETKIYSLFTFDAVKLNKNGVSIPQAVAALTSQLAASTSPVVSPCQIPGDVNATNIVCGLMRFSGNEFFTTTAAISLPGLPFKTDVGVGVEYGDNFLSPNGLIPGDSTGRVVHVHFSQRMVQFGFTIDPGGPSLSGVQFVVNRQTLPVVPLTANTPQFVGVQDSLGFTDITIIPSGVPRTWIGDQFSYLPLSAF